MVERAKIEAQLLELERTRDIEVGLEFSRNSEGEKKKRIDVAPEQPRPIEAKLRALDKFVDQGLSFEEAAELEQREHVVDLERKQGLLEKRQKQGLVIFKGRVLTGGEEARRWAFM